MVMRTARFIMGWFKAFPLLFFCLSSLGMYWLPAFYICQVIAIVCAVIWILTNKKATKLAGTQPIFDSIINFYLRLEKKHNKV